VSEALARNEARREGAVLAGAPLGGALFGIGRALPFVVDALSYVASTISILAIRRHFQEERARPLGRLRDELVEGIRFLWSQPFLRGCAFLFVGSNFLWNAIFLVVVVAGKQQGLSGGRIGLLFTLFGAASLLGGIAAPRIQRRLSMRAIVVTTFWLPLGVLLFVAHADVWLLVGGLVPFALMNPALNATVIGYRTAVTPDRLQGRVNGAARMLAQGAAPLGPLVAGVLLSNVSARSTVVVLTAALGVLAVAATVAPALRDAPSLGELAEVA
jgi:MFS family permease